MKRTLTGVAAVCAIALAACGGPSHQQELLAHPATANKPVVSHDVIVPLKTACPPGRSRMGCSVQPSPLQAAQDISGQSRPPGPIFPDVSSWQVHPNWQEAKAHIYGAVAKLGEYSIDPDVQYNVSAFRSLGIRWSVYLFVRPQGCSTEANLALAWLKEIGGPSTSGPVLVLDEEEPGLAGYATCIDGRIFSVYHRHVLIYTSAGTWSGGSAGSLQEWAASYGPSSPPGCIWGCKLAAWQYTDGHWGYPTYIPGIGAGDVSIAYDFFKGSAPSKPKIVCFGKHRQHTRLCDHVRQQGVILGRLRAKERAYLTVSQHNAVVVQAQISALEKRLAVVEGRAKLEQSKATAYDGQLKKLLAQYGYKP